MIVHGGGSVEVDFGAVASRPVGVSVEPKVCESCMRQFFRPVPLVPSVKVSGVTIRGGERFCPGCRVRKKPVAGVQ